MKDFIDFENNDLNSSEHIKDKAYEKVVHFVKEEIRNNELKIGDKLATERELSERLELSRNSVREALRTMDNMGLISCRQGSGNYLTGDLKGIITESFCMMFMLNQISDKDVSQFRRAIDIQAMVLAVRNITDDDKDEIEALLEKLLQTEQTKGAFVDKEVHMLIAKYSNNKLIEIINESLSRTFDKFIFMARNSVIKYEADFLTSVHKDMLQSLLERNDGKGVLAINKHYDVIDKYI